VGKCYGYEGVTSVPVAKADRLIRAMAAEADMVKALRVAKVLLRAKVLHVRYEIFRRCNS
jgi:hypothetical protein